MKSLTNNKKINNDLLEIELLNVFKKKIKYREKSIKLAKNKLFLALNQWNLNFI
tara:strand:+ start:68 stop:229 length:162 start_codon:yes stop_codon:yes gene_type:complete